MPRIFSKALQPCYSPQDADPLPVDRLASKARAHADHVKQESPPVLSPIPRDVDLGHLKVICSPELIPRKLDMEPWCLPILRTEALLRLSEDYITKTQAYYDSGSMPPAQFDEEVEAEALKLHGLTVDHVGSYREAASKLPLELRSDIFFLRANDRLFHPRAEVAGKKLTGTAHRVDGQGGVVEMQDILNMPRALLVASTSSWPPFLAKLIDTELQRILRQLPCPVVFMYLCEAHASDSWPLSTNAPRNHRSLEERTSAAQAFLQKWKSLQDAVDIVLVDSMDDSITISLGLWPERFLLLEHGTVQWASSFEDAAPADMIGQLSGLMFWNWRR